MKIIYILLIIVVLSAGCIDIPDEGVTFGSDTDINWNQTVNLETQLFIGDHIYYSDGYMKVMRGPTYHYYADLYNYSGNDTYYAIVDARYLIDFV